MRHRPRKTARVCVRTEAVPGPARGRGITSGDGLIRLPRRTDEALRKCKSASTEPALDTRFTGPGIADETVFCLKQENRHAMNRVPAIIAAALIVAAAGQLTSKAQASEIVDPTNAPPVLSTENSSAGGLRLEGGAGYNNGARGMTVSVPGIGSVSTNLLGGDGLAAEAALWFDSPLVALPAMSLGAQYLYFGGSGSVTTSSSAGPILGQTSVTANLNLITHAAMFNAAWHPNIGGVHPFLGAGVGVAFTTLSGSALGFSESNSQAAVAGQAFFGFDYDFTPNVYAGVTGRFFISEAPTTLPASAFRTTSRSPIDHSL